MYNSQPRCITPIQLELNISIDRHVKKGPKNSPSSQNLRQIIDKGFTNKWLIIIICFLIKSSLNSSANALEDTLQ